MLLISTNPSNLTRSIFRRLLPALLLLSLCFRTHAQSLPIMVTMNGIGEIKLGMKKADLEKLMNQSFVLPHLAKINEDDYFQDTVHVNYKGLDADIIFQKQYADNNKWDIIVWEIKSNNPQLKTRSGIGIGDDKYKIISTYDGYAMYIMPEYENNYTVKSKTRSSITLHGDSTENVIIFYLENNKVKGMSITYEEGD